MIDIVFISFDEPNADENFQYLVSRFPHAKRIHGVKGIANAHMNAAKKSLTRFFYVVDGDCRVSDDFEFGFKPSVGDEDYVHIWLARNPICAPYGYGGIKLFHKKFFKNVKSQVDFSTTLTKDIKIHDEIAGTTVFNIDSERAHRAAFRESFKLSQTVNDSNKTESIRQEAWTRLAAWLNPPFECAFRDSIIAGAKEGSSIKHVDPTVFNDHSQ